ncbi:MAG: HAMP domain-containing histidine kinase [Clostridia bacterium]|nr:HAMP domain-containing histidine kinase [Clostridia bacterium]
MRLITRILLCASVLIVAAVLISCALILHAVDRQKRADAIKSAETDFSEIYYTISNVNTVLSDPILCDTYMTYKVKSASHLDQLTLSYDGTYLINNVGFTPEPFLSETSENGIYHYVITRVGGTLYLMIGTDVYYGDRIYIISMVRSLHELDAAMRTLILQCVVIGASVTVLFLFLAWFILSASLKPIRTLQSGAQSIASGDYGTRIDIHRKDEIGRLADEFNTMADAVENSISDLREQNERKQQFINDLSHEMKTPVTSLLLNSETLLTRTVSDADRERALSRIHEQAEWIERLSRKLMQLVVLSDQIELVLSPVVSLFDAVRETVVDSLDRAGVKLTVECNDETFLMDMNLMRSALVNLIENAIKASERGSTVELIARNNEILVRDHGKGIPKDEVARVTEPFYMVDRSRSKKLGGSGLGLALVKRIAEAHHAELVIESELNIGTSIFFRFSDAI